MLFGRTIPDEVILQYIPPEHIKPRNVRTRGEGPSRIIGDVRVPLGEFEKVYKSLKREQHVSARQGEKGAPYDAIPQQGQLPYTYGSGMPNGNGLAKASMFGNIPIWLMAVLGIGAYFILKDRF